MGRPWPMDLIPDTGARSLDDGFYLAEIESLSTQTSSTGKLMANLVVRVVEPVQFAGLPIFENYTLGIDEDPSAEDPVTWKTNGFAKEFRRLISRAKVPATGADLDKDCEAAKGCRVVVETYKEVEPARKFNKSTGVEEDNKYAGRIKTRIRHAWAVGERQPGTNGSGVATTPVAVQAGSRR